MKLIKIVNNQFSGGGIFILALMLSNFINLIFNAYLGRVLKVEDFGLLTFVNTLVLLSGIFIGALGAAVTHRIGYLQTNLGSPASFSFLNSIKNKVYLLSLFISLIWIIFIPISAKFFNIGDIRSLLFFTPVFPLFLSAIVLKGYLTGNLNFIQVAIAAVVESVSKLAFAIILFSVGLGSFAYLSIPLSLFVSFSLLFILTNKVTKVIKKNGKQFAFPRRFLSATILTGLSTSGFLTLDLILVKHYFLPQLAGEYSILSLSGKMIFFFGSLFNGLILTYISRDLGAGLNPGKRFNKLILGTIGLTLISYFGIGVLGSTIIPFIFGSKALAITSFLPTYALAICFFTVSSAFITYHLTLHHYSFSLLSLLSAVSMIFGIYFFHANIFQITQVILFVSISNLISVLVFHILQRNGRFMLRNILDLIDILSPLPKSPSIKGKKILIFNWRDTKHIYAGGAEVYIHELAKRWVKDGNIVNIFCGNDGQSLRNETIDGVKVIRRGGFYFVYLWAFLYYLLRFRGKYDVIIDTQNGVPFFTPLYAKEKKFCLMFHVHQEVFTKSLSKPLAVVAQVLENRLMPWAYRNIKFITISDSSKKEIMELGLGKAGIEVIHPGVDLDSYKSNIKESTNPLIIYVGRLQLYKSVDVFIHSVKNILETIPNAQVVIAGDGEEKEKLENLSIELNINKNIKFLGKITEKDKIKLYQRAWVAVNPSLKEGWGITTIEANASGTPVVASNVAGLRDSVNNSSTGFLVEYGNPKQLSDKIIKIIKDKGLRKEMKKESVKWAKGFDWNTSAKKSMEVIT